MLNCLRINRLLSILLLVCFYLVTFLSNAQTTNKQQRIIIIMMDGFGEAYYRNSKMPTLNDMEKKGIFKIVPSLMPSVTNLNNASIVTGELPAIHGITGNSYVNPTSGEEEFMESADLVLAPTLFERAAKKGIKSILFASKKKTIGLLYKGTSDSISPETASPIWIQRSGTPPSIYSREVNYWLMESALYSLKNDKSLGLFYIHPTDYPMHTWAPEEKESKEHLAKIDEYIAMIIKAAPDAMLLLTADHMVNHKTVCLDIEKACNNRKLPVKLAISAESDKYVKQHRGFGGTSYVYLKDLKDSTKMISVISKFKGVEMVLTRAQAAKKFHLMPGRIGDLVVLGDRNTVFGNLDKEYESLPGNYRTHGSTYEAKVPIFIYQAHNAPPADFFTANYKIAAWLFK